MRYLTIDQICRAVGGTLLQGSESARAAGICTDSRTIHPCDLFVALAGPSFDGHDFVARVLEMGAAGAIVSRAYDGHRLHPHRHANGALIAVDDTIKALGDLARYYRLSLPARIVAVTGSNGKTTTKEMIFHILSGDRECARSPENYNNAVGVPTSLFGIEQHHRAAVVELGTNAPGEIGYLADIVRPHVAVITTVSGAHLEGLSSIKGVADEKAAILDALPDDGMAVLNRDNHWCREIEDRRKGPCLGFGIHEEAEVRATNVEADDVGVNFTCAGLRFLVPTLGEHNIYNALAAAAACRALGVTWDAIRERLRTFSLPKMRMERLHVGAVTLINDAYNANPESMLAALRLLDSLPALGRKIVVMGDMKELGEQAEECHRVVGRKVASMGADVLWAVGPLSLAAQAEAAAGGMAPEQLFSSPNASNAAERLPQIIEPGDVVLVKGSRANALEVVVQALKDALAERRAARLPDVPADVEVPAIERVEPKKKTQKRARLA